MIAGMGCHNNDWASETYLESTVVELDGGSFVQVQSTFILLLGSES
jgi:hypothetical protein